MLQPIPVPTIERVPMKFSSRISAMLLSVFLLLATCPGVLAQNQTNPSETRLLNGLRVLVFKTSEKSVSVKIRINAGASFDMAGKAGTMRLLTEVLFPNEDFRAFIGEEFGTALTLRTNYDFIEIETGAPSEKLLSLLETLSARLISPEINKDTVEAAKRIVMASANASPDSLMNQETAGRLLGSYPHGRPVNGDDQSMSSIDFADIVRARERFLSPDNTTLVIAGDVDAGLMSRATRRFFGPWTRADQKPRWSFANPIATKPQTDPILRGDLTPGTFHFRVGLRNLSRTDSRYQAYLVTRSILTKRIQQRFGNVAVEDRGHRIPGALLLGASSRNRSESEFFGETFLIDASQLEFDAARAHQSGGSASISERWLDMESYSLSSPDTESDLAVKVTLADVNAVLALLRSTASVVLTFAGPSIEGETTR